ncbi:hypothetical protein L7F22_010033 [Adiantum nelumboides]|nr:hypothetical protein [Adiantum nelumboides]
MAEPCDSGAVEASFRSAVPRLRAAFGFVDFSSLIEQSLYPLVGLSDDDEVIAFAAFNDTPSVPGGIFGKRALDAKQLSEDLSCIELASTVLPSINIKQAIVENYDDLFPIVENAQKKGSPLSNIPNSAAPAYPFAMARLIAAQDAKNSVLAAEIDNKLVGVMALTRELDSMSFSFSEQDAINGLPTVEVGQGAPDLRVNMRSLELPNNESNGDDSAHVELPLHTVLLLAIASRLRYLACGSHVGACPCLAIGPSRHLVTLAYVLHSLIGLMQLLPGAKVLVPKLTYQPGDFMLRKWEEKALPKASQDKQVLVLDKFVAPAARIEGARKLFKDHIGELEAVLTEDVYDHLFLLRKELKALEQQHVVQEEMSTLHSFRQADSPHNTLVEQLKRELDELQAQKGARALF